MDPSLSSGNFPGMTACEMEVSYEVFAIRIKQFHNTSNKFSSSAPLCFLQPFICLALIIFIVFAMDRRESAESTNLPSLSDLERLQLIPRFPRSRHTIQDLFHSPLTSSKFPLAVHSEPRRFISSNILRPGIMSSPNSTPSRNQIEDPRQFHSISVCTRIIQNERERLDKTKEKI